jgi:hypothetical protein
MLLNVAAANAVEEIALLTTTHDPEVRRRSYTLVGEALTDAQVALAAE